MCSPGFVKSESRSRPGITRAPGLVEYKYSLLSGLRRMSVVASLALGHSLLLESLHFSRRISGSSFWIYVITGLVVSSGVWFFFVAPRSEQDPELAQLGCAFMLATPTSSSPNVIRYSRMNPLNF